MPKIKIAMEKDLREGIILKLTGGNYYLEIDNKRIKARSRGLFRHQNIKPVVGDHVLVDLQNYDEGYILEVKERKNSLVRPPVANIDQALIVMSFKEPDYSYVLLDKLLAIIEFSKIRPIIIVTKADLANNPNEVDQAFEIYTQAEYDVIKTSIETKENIEQVKALFKDKVSVLVGQSGAGKSSLLNMIVPDLNIETNEISKALNRGKHTTRHNEIYLTEFGMILDSPGFSSLELDIMNVEDLAIAYHDFEKASHHCKFRNCLHEKEPNCEVKRLVETKEIGLTRYENYLQFLQEIKDRKVRY